MRLGLIPPLVIAIFFASGCSSQKAARSGSQLTPAGSKEPAQNSWLQQSESQAANRKPAASSDSLAVSDTLAAADTSRADTTEGIDE